MSQENRLGSLLLRLMLLALGALPFVTAPDAASATTLTVLHSFCGSSTTCSGSAAGASGLLQDSSGNLFGVTSNGGANGKGVVYRQSKSTASPSFTELYSFCPSSGCADGANPIGTLIMDTGGNLYGVTQHGGAGCSPNPNGCGTVFELVAPTSGTTWTLRTLYSFCPSSCNDGRGPQNGLTYVGAATGSLYNGTATLYGTAIAGGVNSRGVVYKLTSVASAPVETVIYAFCPVAGCADGATPEGLITDAIGNLFGLTSNGGVDGDGDGIADGVAYELIPVGGGSFSQTVLYAFCPSVGCVDGENPNGSPIFDGSGNLFGVTTFGGANGGGTVFRIVPSGGSSTESVIHSFCSLSACADGESPKDGVAIDSSGNLYGATRLAGANAAGTVFELSGSTLTTLYNFCSLASCTDGHTPSSSVIIDGSNGRLYGTTATGGGFDGGEVYKLKP
jgi:uncharacterized repeat protein (TIGR03803 family)